MKRVTIMRGLPGSGKSTWVLNNRAKACFFSADHYHYVDKVYKFNPAKAAWAHNQCLRSYLLHLLSHSEGEVVVDNTNITQWEISPYYRAAEALEWEVEIIRIECDPFTAARRNIHEVPTEKIFQMYQNLRESRLPLQWKECVVLATIPEPPLPLLLRTYGQSK